MADDNALADQILSGYGQQTAGPTSHEALADQILAGWGQEAQPAQSGAAGFGRRLALGARDVAEGVVGPVYNLAAAPLRAVGVPVNTFEQNLDNLGVPKAETANERGTSAVVQPMAGTMLTMGAGNAMARSGNAVAQGVGNVLAANPLTQMASAGLGGGVTEATGSPIAGMAAGAILPLAGAGLGRVISPGVGVNTAERAAINATADAENIPLTLGQRTGNRVLRNLESTFSTLPSSSGNQAAIYDAQNQAFNSANLRRAGVDATRATPEVLTEGRAALGSRFNDLTERNNLNLDPEFYDGVGRIASNMQKFATDEVAKPVMGRIQDMLEKAKDGQVSGKAYRELDSALGRTMRSTSNGDLRHSLGEVRDVFRGAMDRSISPEDQAAWREVRGQYANLMTIAKAMNNPSEVTALGNIPAARLASAGNNGPSNGYAFGRGNLDDLARLGQATLKQTVPNSGTAERTMMSNLLTGGNFATLGGVGGSAAMLGSNPLLSITAGAGSVAGPYLANKLYNSSGFQNYLMNNAARGVAPTANALLPIAAETQIDRLRRLRNGD